MCEYCKDTESIYWNPNDRESFIREIYIEQDETMTVTSNYSSSNSINLQLNYCPMCGKKLKQRSKLEDVEITPFEENIVNNVEVLTNEIIKEMRNGNKLKVREYSNYFSDMIDSYCLDGQITFHRTLGTRR